MLAVLAFKRSLSAGILDGGVNEISLGGSRLTRFMKDIERVTGRMGEAEMVTAAEETANVAIEPEEQVSDVGAKFESADTAEAKADTSAAPPSRMSPDPWAVAIEAGAQLVSALAAAGNDESVAHPWIEQGPTPGARSLRLPLPPPEVIRGLADALSALADSLRGSAPRA